MQKFTDENQLFTLRLSKLRQEWDSIEKLRARGMHPIEIADQLIEYTITQMRHAFQKRYPNATEGELLELMRDHVNSIRNLKQRHWAAAVGGTN